MEGNEFSSPIYTGVLETAVGQEYMFKFPNPVKLLAAFLSFGMSVC